MSEIDNTNLTAQSPSLDAELAAAFGTKQSSPQVEGNQQQVGQEGVDPTLDPSRSGSETPPSRTEPASREELLASLTWDEVKALEHLRPAIKSETDQEAARQLKGKEKELENRIRSEVGTDYWKKHFESMDEDTLAETIRTNPDARRLYAQVTTTPPPPDTNTPDPATSIVSYYTNIIQQNSARVAKLPAEAAAALDPTTYTKAHPDMEPELMIAQWQGEIVEAEVQARLEVEKAKLNNTDAESKALEASARNQPNTRVSTDGGHNPADVLPDYGTRSELLLEDAFRRKALTRS